MSAALILNDDEIRDLADGYTRADKQLQALHRAGFVRARRSALTGRIVLERAYVQALAEVAAGKAPRGEAQNDPQPRWRKA